MQMHVINYRAEFLLGFIGGKLKQRGVVGGFAEKSSTVANTLRLLCCLDFMLLYVDFTPSKVEINALHCLHVSHTNAALYSSVEV